MRVLIVLLYFVLFAFSGFSYFCSIFPSVLDAVGWVPDNLYCVGGDVKPSSITELNTGGLLSCGIVMAALYSDHPLIGLFFSLILILL